MGGRKSTCKIVVKQNIFKASDSMGDLITILLVLLDFQLYKMVMRARDLSEIVMLALVDIFIWFLAVIHSHK